MTERARRRKSGWNLLLIPFALAALIGLGLVGAALLIDLQRGIAPDYQRPLLTSSFSSLCIVVGLFLACSCPAFVATNYMIWLIPPARRALDAETEPFPSTQFRATNRTLLRAWALLGPIGGLVAVIGAILPIWSHTP